jgi:hypothetical protein
MLRSNFSIIEEDVEITFAIERRVDVNQIDECVGEILVLW